MTAGPWLSVIGIGEDGVDGLSRAAGALIAGADVVIGGKRHLAMLDGGDHQERIAWPSPMSELVGRIGQYRGRAVCVLASGDPFCFGVGATLARHVAADEMAVIPAPSARSWACCRMRWPEHTTRLVSLVARPLALIEPHLQPGNRLIVLSSDGSTPGKVAEALVARGFGDSRITVFERVGGPAERRIEATAQDLIERQFDPLNVLAIDVVAGAEARPLSTLAGLPEDAFRHDGQVTKREVRAATLAALAPTPGDMLWDVGAGSGSVAIEWMRADPLNRAIALEPRADRRSVIAENAVRLGVPSLDIREGRAPEALSGWEPPDAIFVGGGVSDPAVLDACWEALPPGGRLVANCVTLEGEAELLRRFGDLGGELVRIAVSRAEPVGAYNGWRPMMPVTQWRVGKPCGGGR